MQSRLLVAAKRIVHYKLFGVGREYTEIERGLNKSLDFAAPFTNSVRCEGKRENELILKGIGECRVKLFFCEGGRKLKKGLSCRNLGLYDFCYFFGSPD